MNADNLDNRPNGEFGEVYRAGLHSICFSNFGWNSCGGFVLNHGTATVLLWHCILVCAAVTVALSTREFAFRVGSALTATPSWLPRALRTVANG